MQSLSAFSFVFLVTKKNFTLKSSLVLLYLGYWILLICLVMDHSCSGKDIHYSVVE